MKTPVGDRGLTLLGVCGEKRSGKDTVFQILRGLSYDVHRVAFADPLKEELAAACGVSCAFIEAHKSQFRLGLQWWGTEFRRGFHGEDYWIRRMEDRVASLERESRVVVITDVRFPNEADYVRGRGGHIWKVVRPLPWWKRPPAWFKWQHQSERFIRWLPCDEVIVNGGTLEDLAVQVARLGQRYDLPLQHPGPCERTAN